MSSSDNTTGEATMAEPTLQDVMDRLDRMEKRLDGRIDSVNRRLTGIENRLTSMEQVIIKLTAASPVPV
ncbi:MAG: hypothetical protein OXC06_01965 [Acidimicrobiaceae bacterium]|nr:hypothetical protein [Acidimicrobiaceae bacterium]